MLRRIFTSTVCGITKKRLLRENTVAHNIGRSFSLDMPSAKQQDMLFDLYKDESTGKVFMPKFVKCLLESGIRKDDPRLTKLMEKLKIVDHLDETNWDPQRLYVDKDSFRECIGTSIGVVTRAMKKQTVIPDWTKFAKELDEIFEEVSEYTEGEVADYIPQLARADADAWAVSVCTIDGQRHSMGDMHKPFCLQSVSKPFTYAFVHDEIGTDALHAHVGQEPSGRLFNEICLDHNMKPHNPLINAGAIVVVSMLKRDEDLADRFDFMIHQFRKLCENGYVGFNNSVFLSERETADRNYALSYYMREHKVFPDNTSLQETLDLYFQLCSIETNCDTLASMAATLANGGVNPLSGQRVINNRACRDTLSMMYSCGMYDWSGQFAFRVGLPAKSGVSGAMIIVIPNVMGIALYSPRLDKLGNTVRGVKFAEALVQKYNFHNYDSLVYSDVKKCDPRLSACDEFEARNKFLYAAKFGDLGAIKRHILMGRNIEDRDYEDRTVLHVAASAGDPTILEYLLRKWTEKPDPRDQFDRTPLDDAKFFGHESCVALLERELKKWDNRLDE